VYTNFHRIGDIGRVKDYDTVREAKKSVVTAALKGSNAAALAVVDHATKPITRVMSAHGPDVWSGRASQEVFVDLSDIGLASMYPASHWSVSCSGPPWISGACDLINVQASIRPTGPPVFARTGKTDLPSRLILSQTSSAGKSYRSDYVIARSSFCAAAVIGGGE
jgi:hypothetical protein